MHYDFTFNGNSTGLGGRKREFLLCRERTIKNYFFCD
jgi:hypothetical protein